MVNPSKIVEGAVVYSLGEFDGKKVEYDFTKVLIYLSAKGKLLFGKNFKIYEEDRSVLLKLCNYMVRDFGNCSKYGIDPDKGILLSGPVGCGKTTLMKLLRHLVPHRRPYDLGVEPMGTHFGKDCNVMGEILLSRYEFYQNTKILTHATTNLNAGELEERYGKRVRSRMRQMFNLIAFDQNTKDKRI